MPGKIAKSLGVAKKRASLSLKSLKMGDAKGRIVLGPTVAGHAVQVEEHGVGEWTVRLVEPVPLAEAWLFKNPEALRRLQEGLRQARKREFAPNPMAGRDYAWLDDVDEENV